MRIDLEPIMITFKSRYDQNVGVYVTREIYSAYHALTNQPLVVGNRIPIGVLHHMQEQLNMMRLFPNMILSDVHDYEMLSEDLDIKKSNERFKHMVWLMKQTRRFTAHVIDYDSFKNVFWP